ERDIVKATTAVPGEYAVSRPLEVVQIDHTEIDIIVVDELTRTPLPGRPWLTLAIDVFSRVVTGFHVSMSAPSRAAKMPSGRRRASRRERLGLRMDNGKPSAGFFSPVSSAKGSKEVRRASYNWANFMVDTGHLPSWPLIEIRRPWSSSD